MEAHRISVVRTEKVRSTFGTWVLFNVQHNETAPSLKPHLVAFKLAVSHVKKHLQQQDQKKKRPIHYIWRKKHVSPLFAPMSGTGGSPVLVTSTTAPSVVVSFPPGHKGDRTDNLGHWNSPGIRKTNRCGGWSQPFYVPKMNSAIFVCVILTQFLC